MMKLSLTIWFGASLMMCHLAQATLPTKSIYEFKVVSVDGQAVDLSEYKGKALLIVNTASKCGYTPQYEGLESIYGKYKAKGLVVLGFPSNDFGGQEPGTNSEIKKFCQTRYKVDFPIFSKGPVIGPDRQPIFTYLTQNAPVGHRGEIKWNFEKFLIDREGNVVGRFDSNVKPDSAEFQSALEKNLSH